MYKFSNLPINSGEVLLAAKDGARARIVHELADLWFHMRVWMVHAGIPPAEVEAEPGARYGKSGSGAGLGVDHARRPAARCEISTRGNYLYV